MAIPQDFGALIQDLADTVQAVFVHPSDQMRAMVYLAAVPGTGPIAVRARRAAVINLARASQVYAPTSYDDAQAVLAVVVDAIDTVITEAGVFCDDEVFAAFQVLRQAVIADLVDRGGSLAPLVIETMPAPLPHLVVAERLYDDATRADELVQRVDPVHPLFMPLTMQVLAS